ncbi:anti-sigma regulatory factor (Ser/Thr protein kinase) [Kineococcus xinjiangensis]|uniref:Anti-sigma regulatory factor (Ser/Thr protein kinase) n=1 Tax=Kineococcus xinjiangensis TaxID=512762 RepID=A0A2S6IEM1_9ACTN|nr:ATP-binding protein [Kineococcus xinjiangensis]PPK92662.1 anti-sigma regulatory factor (Ser/Thr protein kinase) [Kineococcus xinjiangensis]
MTTTIDTAPTSPDELDYPWTACVTLPPSPTSPRTARRLLDLVAAAWDVPVPEPAELLLTEVVTNVVVHAHTDMTVHLYAGPAGLRVEVDDSSPEPPHERRPTHRSEHGRGLLLLQRLARQWGYEVHDGPAPAETGKTLWFELSSDHNHGDQGDHDETALHAAFADDLNTT